MEAEELLYKLRDAVDILGGTITSPVMYDRDKFEKKVSFAVFEKNDYELFKRFIVTVEDTLKK